MLYKTLRSFVDPLTGRMHRKGTDYTCSDAKHADKLAAYGLIEPVEPAASPQLDPAPKRSTRKRGGSDGNDT